MEEERVLFTSLFVEMDAKLQWGFIEKAGNFGQELREINTGAIPISIDLHKRGSRKSNS